LVRCPGRAKRDAGGNLRHLPQAHHLPAGGDGADARARLPLRVPAGDAAREQLLEERLAHALRRRDYGLGLLDRLVDGIENGDHTQLLVKRSQRDGNAAQTGCPEFSLISGLRTLCGLDRGAAAATGEVLSKPPWRYVAIYSPNSEHMGIEWESNGVL